MKRKFFGIKAVVLLSLYLLFPCCVLEEGNCGIEEENNEGQISFRVSTGQSKSILGATAGDTSIEVKLTDISWAFYNSLGFIEKLGYSSTAATIVESVRKGEEYTLVILANMGDWRNRFPDKLDEIPDLEYAIPSFESVSDTGIPMSGRFERVSVDNQPGTVYLDRLFAKIYLRIDKSSLIGSEDVSLSFDGLKSGSVYVRNCNKVLKPFGESRASGPEDILARADRMEDMGDIDDLMAESGLSEGSISSKWGPGPAYAVDTTLVFYVPENLQGNLLSGSDSWGKTADAIGASNAAKCSYIEYSLEIAMGAVGGFGGEVKYRFFLGEDAEKNFDVKRNSVYRVHLSMTSDGTLKDNWKVERGDDFMLGLQLSWKEESGSWKTGKAPEYLGQGGVLTVSGTKNVTNIVASPSGLVRLTKLDDSSYEVYAIGGASTVTITVSDATNAAISSEISFGLKLPIVQMPSYSVTLNPDGTEVAFKPRFICSDGTELDMSRLHPEAYSDFYKPALVKVQGSYIPYLSYDAAAGCIYFSRSGKKLQTLAESGSINGTHALSFGSEEKLYSRGFSVKYQNPFEYVLSSVQLEKVDNCALLFSPKDMSTSAQIAYLNAVNGLTAAVSWKNLSRSITLDHPLVCSSAADVSYAVTTDGNSWNPSITDAYIVADPSRNGLVLKSNLTDNSPAIGRHGIVARVHNKHTPEDYVSREVANFYSYVHVCVGADRNRGDSFIGSDPAGIGEYNGYEYTFRHLYAPQSRDDYDDYFGVFGFVTTRFLHNRYTCSDTTSPLLNTLGNCPSDGDQYGCTNIVKCSMPLTLTDVTSPIYDNAYRNAGNYGTYSVRLYDPGNLGNTHSERFEGIGDLLYRVTCFTTHTSPTYVDGNWKTLLELDSNHAPKLNYYSYKNTGYILQQSFPYLYNWKGGPSTDYLYIYRLQDIVPSTKGWIDLL